MQGSSTKDFSTESSKKKIGDTMEVYVDDMVIKIKEKKYHLFHLQKSFELLQKYNLKLNLEKCTFGAASVDSWGTWSPSVAPKANLDQIKAIMEMRPPRTIKQIQSLTGKVAFLSRFFHNPLTSANLSLPQ